MGKTKGTILTILGIVLFIGIILALDYGSVLWQSVIAPKREEVRREVFEQTRSFNEGMAQELADYKYQWDRAELGSRDREVIEATIRHRFADYDAELLPSGLGLFLNQVRGF